MSEDVSPKKKKRYSKEFKHDAKKRVKNGEKEDKVARDLGIPRSTIATWMQKDRENQQQRTEEHIWNGANSQENINGNNDNWQTTEMTDCPEMKSVGKDMDITFWFKRTKNPTSDGSKKIKESTITSSDPCFINDTKDGEKEDRLTKDINVAKSTIPTEIFYDRGKSSTSVSKKGITDKSEKGLCTNMYNEPQKSVEQERKKYSSEQQRLAVTRVLEGTKIASVSKDMDIPPSTISTWLKKNNQATSDKNGKTVVNLDGSRCEVKHDIFPGCTESTDNSTIHTDKIIGNSTITKSKNCTNDFEYKEGSEGTKEKAKNQSEKTNNISANDLRNTYSKQQKCNEVGQTSENDIPQLQKTNVISITPPSASSIWISKAKERFREIDMSSLHDVRLNNQLRNETENGSEQSSTNASSNESFELFSSPALNKTECSTSAAVLGNIKERTERKTSSVFPQGDIQKNKKQKKLFDEKSGLCSGTDNIKTGNTVSLTERSAKNVDSSGEKRTGYTPEVKRDVLERVKGGKTIATWMQKDRENQQQSTEEHIRNGANSQENINGNNDNWQTTEMTDCPEMKSVGKDMDITFWFKRTKNPTSDGSKKINDSTSTSSDPCFINDTKDGEKEDRVTKDINVSKSTIPTEIFYDRGKLSKKGITDKSEKGICTNMYNEPQKSVEQERKKYSSEQQRLAVTRVLEGTKIASVSKDMDIPPSTISTWLKKNNQATSDKNGKTVVNLDGSRCKVKHDIFPGCTESTDNSTIHTEKIIGNSTITKSKNCTNDFEYKEGSEGTKEKAKNQSEKTNNISANDLRNTCSKQQKCDKVGQTFENDIPQLQKTNVISITPPSDSSIGIAKAKERFREIDMSSLHDVRLNNQFRNETENGSEQSSTNASSNEIFELFSSPALNKTECSTSAAVLGNIKEITERKTVSVFPQGDIQKNKEQNKLFDEKSGLCSGTDNIKTGNTVSLTERSAKNVDSSGEQRTGYTPEVKRDVLERVKGGKTIASVSKDLKIPASTIRDWARKEKIGEKAKQDDCILSLKGGKWQEIMSSINHGKGWAERDTGYRLKNLSPHFEDRYGLFQLAFCKPTEKSIQADNIVYVKDGKILTLIERHCKYGFQKSSLINDKLKHGYSIKAQCCYLTSQEEAAQEKTTLLQRKDYAWNKPCRDDVCNSRLSGDWSKWLLVMSPDDMGDDWIKRDGKQVGYKRKQLEAWFNDEFGIFEMAIRNPDTEDDSVVCLASGKILTVIGKYCSDDSSAKSKQINDALYKGYGILVRYCYALTEEEARKLELQFLTRYVYKWHKQRTKREDIKDEQVMYKWTDWKLIMAPVKQDGFVRRDGRNVGFRHDSLEALFEDRFGVFELQVTKSDCKEVTYVQHGNILILLQRYCNDGYKRSALINRKLDEGYSISVRHQYVNSDNGKRKDIAVLQQLLAIYDYAWNKTRREHIDDEDIAGDWSDWVTVMTPQIQMGWTQRNLGYHLENFTELFEEKYGNFEMQVEFHPHLSTSGNCEEEVHGKNEKMGTVVYLGKGNILTEVKARCCIKTKQSVLIDQALKDGKSISVRYCYTENDTIEEAAELERQLLDRYDYPWIRSKREDVDDNDLPGEWSEWSKIMKPGEVEKDWEWRDEKYIGFKAKNLDGICKDDYGVFELAIEKPYQTTVVHVGQGKVLSELKKYCKINVDGSYKFLQISDALAKRCNILVRHRDVQTQQRAKDVEHHLVERYEYSWNPLNRTKREEVDDSSLPGQNWSEWQLLMASKHKGPGWIRRDSFQTGYRLTEGNKDDESGIYELKIRKDGRTVVVYVGKAEQLSQRHADYCKNGSHLKIDINRALQYEYDIWVRTRPTLNIDFAENKLLDRYNYAWNKLRNGKERDIFLPYNLELN